MSWSLGLRCTGGRPIDYAPLEARGGLEITAGGDVALLAPEMPRG